LVANEVRWQVERCGRRSGQIYVRWEPVGWTFQPPDSVVITFLEVVGLLERLEGLVGRPKPRKRESSTARVTATELPSGGRRWWWVCPGCGRRRAMLYLRDEPPRLSCRVCQGLKYRSQYRRPPPTGILGC
jgi:hypothetical protein